MPSNSLHPGEMLAVAEPLLGRNIHPTVITAGYYSALQKVCEYCERVARKVDVQNRAEFNSVIRSCIGTKFINRFGPGMVDLAIDAVMTVSRMQVTRQFRRTHRSKTPIISTSFYA